MAIKFPSDPPPNRNPLDLNDMDPEQVRALVRRILQALVGIPILILLAVGGLSTFYTVQPEERAVVKRFGKVIGEPRMPGLHFKLPWGIETVQLVPTERVMKEEFGFQTVSVSERTEYTRSDDDRAAALMLTGDLNISEVTWVVQFRISDPVKYIHSIRDPRRTLRDSSEAVMRRIVGNRLGSDVLTVGRVSISIQAREEIQQIMDILESGVAIITVELQDVVPPARVQPAFNDVNVARQERERLINDAERLRNREIPKALGESNRIIAEAQGYASERVNRARGEAVRFTSIYEEYKQAPDVTRQRMYLETIDKVLPRAGQLIITQPGEGSKPLPVLNLDQAKRTGASNIPAASTEAAR